MGVGFRLLFQRRPVSAGTTRLGWTAFGVGTAKEKIAFRNATEFEHFRLMAEPREFHLRFKLLERQIQSGPAADLRHRPRPLAKPTDRLFGS